MAEDELRVFQPFFLKIDLPYSVIRAEEFPVKVSIYNYLDKAQTVYVEIVPEPWFDLLDNTVKTVEVGGNDIGSSQFVIRPRGLGVQQLTITARSTGICVSSSLTTPSGLLVPRTRRVWPLSQRGHAAPDFGPLPAPLSEKRGRQSC